MAINFTRYVDITSGVGAGVNVPQRDLIGRFFTDNNILPPQSLIEFSSAAEVGSYFGTSSTEYLRSVFYFSWVSKNITRAQNISFARWVDAAVEPRIYGNTGVSQSVGLYTGITAGAFKLTMAANQVSMTGLDFSGALSLADVAGILQTAIRTDGSAYGALWTSATVTYDSTRASFDFVGGATGACTISVQPGASNDISTLIGWLPAATMVGGVFVNGAITAPGSDVETITDTLANSAAASNNFGSYAFMPTLDLAQIIESATWNKTNNVLYMYSIPVTLSNASAWADPVTGVGAIGGCCMTVSMTSGEYPEQVPMMIEAATNYAADNSVQNYMFQQFVLTPSVSTDTSANSLDALSVNYYGQTQTAGQLLSFYQRGVMMGLATDPLDMNTYANEQWLKDAAGAQIMTLLLSLARVSANAQGVSQILAILQAVINQALNNGTISVGKTLSPIQQVYITELTNDPNAWYQVQNIGYWVDCVITSSGSPLVYTATYTLVYSKDDVIRKVNGTHVLI